MINFLIAFKCLYSRDFEYNWQITKVQSKEILLLQYNIFVMEFGIFISLESHNYYYCVMLPKWSSYLDW